MELVNEMEGWAKRAGDKLPPMESRQAFWIWLWLGPAQAYSRGMIHSLATDTEEAGVQSSNPETTPCRLLRAFSTFLAHSLKQKIRPAAIRV